MPVSAKLPINSFVLYHIVLDLELFHLSTSPKAVSH